MRHKFNSEASQNRRSFGEMGVTTAKVVVKNKQILWNLTSLSELPSIHKGFTKMGYKTNIGIWTYKKFIGGFLGSSHHGVSMALAWVKGWYVCFVFFDSKSSGRKRDGCYGYCSVWKQDVSNPELIILIITKKSCVPYSIMLTLSVLVTMWRKPLEAKTKVHFTSTFGDTRDLRKSTPCRLAQSLGELISEAWNWRSLVYNSSVWSHWTGQLGHFWGAFKRTPWVLVARVKARREASWLSQKIWELKEVKFWVHWRRSPFFHSLLCGCGCGGCADFTVFCSWSHSCCFVLFFSHPFWCFFVYVCIIFSVLFVKIASLPNKITTEIIFAKPLLSERTGFFQFAMSQVGVKFEAGRLCKSHNWSATAIVKARIGMTVLHHHGRLPMFPMVAVCKVHHLQEWRSWKRPAQGKQKTCERANWFNMVYLKITKRLKREEIEFDEYFFLRMGWFPPPRNLFLQGRSPYPTPKGKGRKIIGSKVVWEGIYKHLSTKHSDTKNGWYLTGNTSSKTHHLLGIHSFHFHWGVTEDVNLLLLWSFPAQVNWLNRQGDLVYFQSDQFDPGYLRFC